jgi:hypothetical protein
VAVSVFRFVRAVQLRLEIGLQANGAVAAVDQALRHVEQLQELLPAEAAEPETVSPAVVPGSTIAAAVGDLGIDSSNLSERARRDSNS